MISIIGYIILGIIMDKLNMLSGWWLVLYISGWVLDALFGIIKMAMKDS